MQKKNINISFYLPNKLITRKQFGKLELYSIGGRRQVAYAHFLKNIIKTFKKINIIFIM